MKTLDRITTNGVIVDIYEEPAIRVLVSVVSSILLGTLFAALLDVNTALPVFIWTSMWYVVPILTWMFFGLPARYGYAGMNGRTQSAMKTYLNMPKAEKREFPKNTMKMLATQDWDVIKDFEDAADDLVSLRYSAGTDVEAAREAMAQVRSNIAITKKTYEELG